MPTEYSPSPIPGRSNDFAPHLGFQISIWHKMIHELTTISSESASNLLELRRRITVHDANIDTKTLLALEHQMVTLISLISKITRELVSSAAMNENSQALPDLLLAFATFIVSHGYSSDQEPSPFMRLLASSHETSPQAIIHLLTSFSQVAEIEESTASKLCQIETELTDAIQPSIKHLDLIFQQLCSPPSLSTRFLSFFTPPKP
jgi:hypothetical protein